MAKYPHPKSVLITGASSGIGEALALQYAGPDVTLFLNGRNEERLTKVADACRAKGATASIWVGDVTDAQGMEGWITASNAEAPLNLVIANAGIAGGGRDVAGLHGAAKDTYDVNVYGVFNTVHPALNLMAARSRPVRDGQIAIIGSAMGYVGTARSPAYSSSKAAVNAYGQGLRGKFRAMGIGVSVICPGYVKSRLIGSIEDMPFVVEADHAARVIARGLARNKARITFPWQVMVIARIAMNLPNFLADRLNRPWGVAPLE